jgi:GT2 family glycosyltransferase
VRRQRWRELGGFDPRFRPAWWEDVDLCARLAATTGNDPAAGFVVEPRATVVHAGGTSVPRLGSTTFLRVYHRNLLRYAATHHPRRLGSIRTVLRSVLIVRGMLRPEMAVARSELE